MKCGLEKQYFFCKSTRNGQSRLDSKKNLGSCKAGGHCTSTIEARKKADGSLCAVYYETHHSHDNTLHQVTLQGLASQENTEKFLVGIPHEKILSDIMGTVDGEIEHHHPVSKKELDNIWASCGISPAQKQVHFKEDIYEKHIPGKLKQNADPTSFPNELAVLDSEVNNTNFDNDAESGPEASDEEDITDEPLPVPEVDNLEDIKLPLVHEDTESMKKQIDDLRRKCSELEKEKHKADDLRIKCSELEKEKHEADDLRRKCSELEKEKHKADDLRRKCSELQKEKHEADDLRRKCSELEKEKHKADDLRRKCSELQKEKHKADLKRKCSELKKEKHKADDLRRKFSELEKDTHTLVKNLSTFLNLDQLDYVKGKRHKNWSDDTIKKALQIESAGGYSGYQTLIEQGYPLPPYRTLFIHTSGTLSIPSES